jgi:hypothetical protein
VGRVQVLLEAGDLLRALRRRLVSHVHAVRRRQGLES